ncbi:MAG: NAD(P)/FAD-dependent oxidoreductase [Nitrosopumilus sp. H8]|nr:MAG: NAD(P)/FAD-dependent oxidoreductase [Nitrosopumilus sp. H13]RNJ79125.1 MAG: NAD(P)/FAD-dependent oxidoreductase [Nitrosopumilus sp. H8]
MYGWCPEFIYLVPVESTITGICSILDMDGKAQIVNFSLRKEVFFIALGSMLGAGAMLLPTLLPNSLSNLSISSDFYTFWVVAARVLGSDNHIVGVFVHLSIATIIGIVVGLILYKTSMLNISKLSNGIAFGLLTGGIVTVVFTLPAQYFWIQPTIAEINNLPVQNVVFSEVFWIRALVSHFVWGATLGIVASILTRKKGTNYRCHRCDIEFGKLATYEAHEQYIHGPDNPDTKKILILGGGYAGVGVLNHIQEKLHNDVAVSITLVSESNFFLHTPMLPEMATGTIEPRHIATPIRNFCRRARFYHARVMEVDTVKKSVSIQRSSDGVSSVLHYDYLVLALGSKTNFFGNENIEKNAFTIKSLDDAIRIRNHIISMLEAADQESDPIVQERLATFMVVGGGFSGVETVGEINDFVRDSVTKFYRNIDPGTPRIILVASGEKILPEIGNLGVHAKKSLEESGVTMYTKTRLADLVENVAHLNNSEQIPCHTVIWAGGNAADDVIARIDTEHYKNGSLIVDQYMRLKNHPEVFALGDCSYVTDPRTGKPYPPTAQHAIRQAGTVSENLLHAVRGTDGASSFVYDTKGSMAKIGKKDGVALLMGREFRGFVAWFIWKQYYLSTLPTFEKRLRVGLDWFIDLFFPRDITRLD